MRASKKRNRQGTPGSDTLTFIGPGTTVVGDVVASAPLRIDGRIQGAVKAKEEVTIGESGLVEGPVHGVNVVIAGEVSGNVHVTGNLRVLATGRLIGDAYTPNLVIDEGAVFRGKCEMTTETKPAKAPREAPAKNGLPEASTTAKISPHAPS